MNTIEKPNDPAWEAVARRVLRGDFARADRTARKALLIGLEGTAGSLCAKAAALLAGPDTGKPSNRFSRFNKLPFKQRHYKSWTT